MLRERLLTLAKKASRPLLMLDTSGSVSSLALVIPETSTVLEREVVGQKLPSEALSEGLVQVLRDVDIEAAALGCIVVGVGPGSFTGLRVGLALAKGLAVGADIPLLGVSSLAVQGATFLAEPRAPSRVVVVRDARRGQVFAACFEKTDSSCPKVLLEDAVIDPHALHDELADMSPEAVVGDGSAACQEVATALSLPYVDCIPRALLGGVLVEPRLLDEAWDDVEGLTPRYLRLSEAERQLLAAKNG